MNIIIAYARSPNKVLLKVDVGFAPRTTVIQENRMTSLKVGIMSCTVRIFVGMFLSSCNTIYVRVVILQGMVSN